MTAVGLALTLTAFLFVAGIVVSVLLLMLVGKLTAPRKKNGKEQSAEDSNSAGSG